MAGKQCFNECQFARIGLISAMGKPKKEKGSRVKGAQAPAEPSGDGHDPGAPLKRKQRQKGKLGKKVGVIQSPRLRSKWSSHLLACQHASPCAHRVGGTCGCRVDSAQLSNGSALHLLAGSEQAVHSCHRRPAPPQLPAASCLRQAVFAKQLTAPRGQPAAPPRLLPGKCRPPAARAARALGPTPTLSTTWSVSWHWWASGSGTCPPMATASSG